MRQPIVLLALLPVLFCLHALGDAPSTQPDNPESKALRQKLVEWDQTFSKLSLQDVRKTYHTNNEREAIYIDWVAHENWEEAKTEQAVGDKWGKEIESQFAHFLSGTTQEDDQICDINVDGDHATVSWKIKDVSSLPMIKIDGQWLVDGHAMFEENLKDNPNMETEKQSTGKLMKQTAADIAVNKFDDGDMFMKDFQSKYQAPTDGN